MHNQDSDAVFDQIFRAAVAGLPVPQASPDFDDRIIDEVVTQSTWRADALVGMRRFVLAVSMALAVFFPLTYVLTPVPTPVDRTVLAPSPMSAGSVPIYAPLPETTGTSSPPAQTPVMMGTPSGGGALAGSATKATPRRAAKPTKENAR